MRRFMIILSLFLGVVTSSYATTTDAESPRHRHDSSATVEKRKPLVLGKRIARDTTGISKRSLRTHLIIPKHDWQIGMAASYVNLSADNSEYLLLLDKSNAYLSLARISINAAYAYCDNHSVGLRLQYNNGN